MSIPLALVFLVGGIALLGGGADVLVRGAVTLARAARVPVAVIGLTVVSMGTSLPELTVTIAAALRGSDDIGLGNVVGSNIFNIGVVLGLSALIQPMRVHGTAVKLEWPFMFLASFQLLLLARDGELDRLEGAFFLVGLILFTAYVVRLGRSELKAEESADLAESVELVEAKSWFHSLGGAILLVVAGSGILILGGNLLVTGAVELARAFGMSERVIGLTIVAAGTSAPEVATSLLAALRGQNEIALGNVIGSNIFNVLAILGVGSVLTPLRVAPELIASDLWWMLGLSLVLFPMMRAGHVLGRRDGALLFGGYAVYLTLLVVAG
ncbi:MAG: calcium/sodium antiporter [Gemmatimonadetes bacterium]|nr:calcium/sodium antiporter [Gemmatimonadota bacterium]